MNQSNRFVEHSSSKSSINFLQIHSICQNSCKVNSLDQKSFLCSQLDLFHTLRPQAFPFTSQTSPPVTPLTSSSSQTQVTVLNMQHRFVSSSCFVCTSFPPPQMHSCFMLITKLYSVFVIIKD